MANTVPFLILGSIVALRKPRRFWPIVITITVVGGFAVWLLGPTNTVTIGASGVVFGLLTYLITAGILTRHWLDVVIAVGVLFVYGGILIGALPFGVSSGVSWLAHLTGAAAVCWRLSYSPGSPTVSSMCRSDGRNQVDNPTPNTPRT